MGQKTGAIDPDRLRGIPAVKYLDPVPPARICCYDSAIILLGAIHEQADGPVC